MIEKDSLIVNISEVNRDTKMVGSKAANLGELIQNKFTVPNAFVLTTRTYEIFLDNNSLIEEIQKTLESIDYNNYESIKSSANNIRNLIESNPLPQNVIEEIKNKYNDFSSYGIAVRSSATAEDLPKTSFAGLYDTYLNLKSLKQILHSIKKCYASLWKSQAIFYRYKNNIPHDKVKIAVIIQKMVSAKSAGILFTINPLTFNNNQLLLESNFGLGESIVSGRSSPDQFILQKIKGGSVKILNRRIGNKKLSVVPKPSEINGGIDYVKLSDDLNQQASLSDVYVRKIAELGLKIQKIFKNFPQDIEWALSQDNTINILQTRPVTGIKTDHKITEILWSRGYSDDYWNDNVTPLYFELLGDQLIKVVNMELNSIMGYKKMDFQLLKLYNAHVYFNLNVLKKKVECEIPKFMRNEDVLNYFPEGFGTYGKKTIQDLPFHLIRRIVAELRISIHDPKGSISKTADAYETWTQEIFEVYCKKFDMSLRKLTKNGRLLDFITLAEELDKIMISHFRLVRYGIPVHNIGMNLLIQYLLTRFLSREECQQYYPVLVSGLNHKLTETNDQIHYLASLIYNSPKLKSIIINQKSHNIYSILVREKDPSIKNFLSEFENFLEKHGDRGFSRDIYYPRWREPPMKNIFDIFKSLVQDDWQKLENIKKKNMQKRQRIEQIVEKKIRTQRFGFLKWKVFSIILKNSRKYIIFRENQRFNLDRWITRNRNVYLEIGKIFMDIGLIEDVNEVFFFSKQEIKSIEGDKYNDQEIQRISSEITKRYDHFKKYENILPPKFLFGSREFNDVIQYNKENKIFYGIPASQGITVAPVCVLQDIDSISTIRKGEILVVPRTDPGWTPVFSKIGGLITETGGILSHGAVIAREYGIPAVTNITNACKIFKTGQIFKINGFNGTIVLEN